MRKIVVLIIVSLILTIPLQAEEYELHEPTATEYMRFVSENLSCGWQEFENYSRNPWDLCSYVIDTIEANYRDDFEHLPYDLLIGAYNALQPGDYNFSPGNPVLWNAALVMAWLRDNAIDLTDETQLSFDHLSITVNPRDFNADGVDEYFLEVATSGFEMYMVVQLTDDSGYREVPTGLPYHQDTVPSWYDPNSYLREIAFDDFNDDGLPEWFLVFEGAQYWDDYFGNMYLLTWRDNRLQSAIEFDTWLPYIPFADTNATNLHDTSLQEGYVFYNLDDDPTLEFQSISVEPNNWRCPETHTTVFDWDAEAKLYIQHPPDITFTDTLSCIVAPAESRFWERDYYAAARLYEYALTLPVEESEDGYFQELKQYVQLRLVQSYLLSGQLSSADELLAQLQDETMLTTLSQTLLDLLLTHRTSEPETLCIALYNLMEESVYRSLQLRDWYEHFNTQLLLGMNERYTTSGYMPEAANAGCNIPAKVDEILTRDIEYVPPSMQLPNSTALDSLLRSGFAVNNYIHADFNGDGMEDWLIWHEAHVLPVLLIAVEELEPFILSRVQQLEPYSRYTRVETVTLPDGAGTAVVTFLPQENFRPGWGGFDCGDMTMLGGFSIWQYTESGFRVTHNAQWCADRPSVAEIFGHEDGLDVLYTRINQNEPVQYVWDSTFQQYVLPATQATNRETVPYNSPVLATPTEPSNADLYNMLGDGIQDYYKRLDEQVRNAESVDESIAILDTEINAPYMEYPQALQFWKATILREAGRNDEAVAEYVALYNSAPDSVWGLFAALHFEVIDENK